MSQGCTAAPEAGSSQSAKLICSIAYSLFCLFVMAAEKDYFTCHLEDLPAVNIFLTGCTMIHHRSHWFAERPCCWFYFSDRKALTRTAAWLRGSSDRSRHVLWLYVTRREGPVAVYPDMGESGQQTDAADVHIYINSAWSLNSSC